MVPAFSLLGKPFPTQSNFFLKIVYFRMEKEEIVKETGIAKKKSFRKANDSSTQFYRENHEKQTLKYVLKQKEKYNKLNRIHASIWDMFDILDKIVDESDPDTVLPQSQHAFQTAEAIRKDGHPDWFVLTGLIHDMGKILVHFGEPQWAVVGDTFPVGCRFSHRIVHYGFFHYNPDFGSIEKSRQFGIYKRDCGWDNVHFSWGHDEYMYQVLQQAKTSLPEEALYIIRYHSFYAGHKEDAYRYLMSSKDHKLKPWLKKFQPYDLYSKEAETVDVPKIKPYYEKLVKKYLPEILKW